jgi:hypothetical protein
MNRLLPVLAGKGGMDIITNLATGADRRKTMRVQMECMEKTAMLNITAKVVETAAFCVQEARHRETMALEDKIRHQEHLDRMEEAGQIFAYRMQFDEKMSAEMREKCDEAFFSRFR